MVIGGMTDPRWGKAHGFMIEAGPLKAGVDRRKAHAIRFVKGQNAASCADSAHCRFASGHWG